MARFQTNREIPVQQRYTPQLPPTQSNSAKLRSISYLGLRYITAIFHVLSWTYGDGAGLIISKLRSIAVDYGPLRLTAVGWHLKTVRAYSSIG